MKNTKNNEDKIYSISNKLITIGFIGIGIIVIGAGVFILHISINAIFTEGQQNILVAFGEYFGGSLSPILAFLALIALLFSIHYQVTEFQKSTAQLEESSIALKNQNELIQKQNFETTFFHMLELYNQTVQDFHISKEEFNVIKSLLHGYHIFPEHILKQNELRSRQAVKILFGMLKFFQISKKQACETSSDYQDNQAYRRVMLNSSYIMFYQMYGDKLGHYFRIIYNILKYIHYHRISEEENSVDYKRKKFYTNILRAQFSEFELGLILYNSISKYGEEKMLPLVEKYELLKHLEINPQSLVQADDINFIKFVLDETGRRL